jgi:hypothetical protein
MFFDSSRIFWYLGNQFTVEFTGVGFWTGGFFVISGFIGLIAAFKPGNCM